jgi:hypothetical protein
MRARVLIFPTRPQDPRRRQVVSYVGGKRLRLTLECGHEVVRQTICIPTHIICEQCPAGGGMTLSR